MSSNILRTAILALAAFFVAGAVQTVVPAAAATIHSGVSAAEGPGGGGGGGDPYPPCPDCAVRAL